MPVPPALFLLALLRVLGRGVLVFRGQRAFNRGEGAFGGIREWTGGLQLQILLKRLFGAIGRYYFLGVTWAYQLRCTVLILRVGMLDQVQETLKRPVRPARFDRCSQQRTEL